MGGFDLGRKLRVLGNLEPLFFIFGMECYVDLFILLHFGERKIIKCQFAM